MINKQKQDPSIAYNDHGLVSAIVQNVHDKNVLMMAWMNEDAYKLSQKTGQAHYWSWSRNQLWRKGETSGNTLQVKQILIDCDGDTILLWVDPAGPACYTGNQSCLLSLIGG